MLSKQFLKNKINDSVKSHRPHFTKKKKSYEMLQRSVVMKFLS
jgi:hypothetical protein